MVRKRLSLEEKRLKDIKKKAKPKVDTGLNVPKKKKKRKRSKTIAPPKILSKFDQEVIRMENILGVKLSFFQKEQLREQM
jgi:hypothetical protein